MSVVKMGLVAGREATFGKITECKSKLKWLAQTDNRYDSEPVIADFGYSNDLLPLPYITFHPFFPTHLCREITFAQDSRSPCQWDITATFSSEPLKVGEEDDDPFSRLAKIKWKTQSYRQAIDRDIYGNAIVNSAGDYFQRAPEVDRSRIVVTISKNVPSIPVYLLSYADAINVAPFTIVGIGVEALTAKVSDLEISDLQTEGDYEFFIFSYSIEFRNEGFSLALLDQGFRYLDGSTLKNIVDGSTPPRPVSSERLLDGAGGILASPSADTAKFLTFEVANQVDFSVLPGLLEWS